MGREVRRVPSDWLHPRQTDNHKYQPLYDESYVKAAKEWKANFLAWEAGYNVAMDRPRGSDDNCEFWDYDGNPPDRECYRPEWPEDTRTHLQMYETTSEGTPISPVMATPEELAQWLFDNNASSFGSDTASYEAWLRVAQGNSACSAVVTDAGLVSGVEAMNAFANEPSLKAGGG